MEYNNLTVTEFCHYLTGQFFKRSNKLLEIKSNDVQISELEMYRFIKEKTENFNHILFNIFIKELRNFSCCIPVEYIGSFRNKPVRFANSNFERDDTLKRYSLTQRIEYIREKTKLSKIKKGEIFAIDFIFPKLIEFSNLAEYEYKKICTLHDLSTPPPIQLTRTLKSTQQKYLFNKLIENELFLPKNTNYESFCHVFGGSVKPDDFEVLEWRETKQTLRELIVGLKNANIEITQHKYPIPPYFKKKGRIINNLPGHKKRETPESKKIAEYIKNIATR